MWGSGRQFEAASDLASLFGEAAKCNKIKEGAQWGSWKLDIWVASS